MKRLIRIMLSLLLVSFILIPNVFAQNNINSAKMVKFNGIYDAPTVAREHDTTRDKDGNISEESDRNVAVHASLRFFSNGEVTEFWTPSDDIKPANVYKKLEVSPLGRGEYTVRDGKIEAKFFYSEGTIIYKGTMENGDKLNLDCHSNINNIDTNLKFNFIEVQ
jgi:hypothetical protein